MRYQLGSEQRQLVQVDRRNAIGREGAPLNPAEFRQALMKTPLIQPKPDKMPRRFGGTLPCAPAGSRRVAIGQATAALPISVMNSRRFIANPAPMLSIGA